MDGTKAVVAALAAEGEAIDHCIVGEPTSSAAARRHDQDRPPRQPQRLHHRRGRAGPRRLSAPRRQPDPGADPPAGRAAGAACWTRAIPSSSPRTWRSPPSTSAIRPPTSSRAPRQRPAQHPLQPRPHRRGAAATGSRRRRRRPARASRGEVGRAVEISGEAFLTEPGPFVDAGRPTRSRRWPAAGPSSPPPAAPPTPASSARSARSSSSAWSARPCTRSTSARRSPRSNS